MKNKHTGPSFDIKGDIKGTFIGGDNSGQVSTATGSGQAGAATSTPSPPTAAPVVPAVTPPPSAPPAATVEPPTPFARWLPWSGTIQGTITAAGAVIAAVVAGWVLLHKPPEKSAPSAVPTVQSPSSAGVGGAQPPPPTGP